MNKLSKLTPAWHQEAAELLKKHFAEIHSQFLDSTKKAVWLGIFLNEIKERGKQDGSIPHGEFGPFLKKHFPEVTWRQITTYMQIGRNVCEKGKFQIGNYFQFAANGDLPPEIEKMIEGKSQKDLQLCLDLKQVDDEGKPQRGQKKGSAGLTKKMRLDAKFKSEAARMEALALNVPQVSLWLKKNCNALGFPQLPKDKLEQIREAITDTHLFFVNLDKQK